MTWLWIISLILLFSVAYAAASGAPWVPTWKRDIERIARLLDLKAGEKFVELGCGDGRVTVSVARRRKRFGGSENLALGTSGPQTLLSYAVGVELSLLQFLAAQIRRVLTRSWNVHFVLGNAFSYNLSGADAIYMFLMPETYEKIRPKLEAELKPGARVVTYVWPIPGWEPVVVDEMEGASKVYLYRIVSTNNKILSTNN